MLDFQERVLLGTGIIPFQEMAKAGIDSDEIKKQIIWLLNPFFENKNLLNDFALDSLAPEADNCRLLKKNPRYFELFESTLKIYRAAKKLDPEACYKTCAAMEFEVSDGLKHYWSTSYAEVSKNNLELSDFAFESFRQIGAITEACVQPILKEVFFILKIVNKEFFDFADKNDFGKIVTSLIKLDEFANHFAFTKEKITLNQIRNIAQHLNFKIQNNMVVVSYKNGNEEASLSREELEALLEDILFTFNAVRLARVIFNVDNILCISKYVESRREHRDDQIFYSIVSGLTARGFQCRLLKTFADSIRVELVELRTFNRQRAFEAMHYLNNVWKFSQKGSIQFLYTDRREKNIIESVLDKESGLKLNNKEITIESYFRGLTIKETVPKFSFLSKVFNRIKSIFGL